MTGYQLVGPVSVARNSLQDFCGSDMCRLTVITPTSGSDDKHKSDPLLQRLKLRKSFWLLTPRGKNYR